MDRLIEGYRRFREQTWPAERARYETLAERGQRPETLVLTCSDSRVDPQTVFGAGPGELFVIRNVAALIPPYQPDDRLHGTSAALEYGVRVLKVRQIVVLGHAQCGGIQARVEGVPPIAQDFVGRWLKIADPIFDDPAPGRLSGGALLEHYEKAAVRLSLRNLRTFPWIAEAIEEGRLALHGFRFGIQSGGLSRLTDGEFVPVT